jgi:hypothetical protein
VGLLAARPGLAQVISTTAGNGAYGFSGDTGPATAAQIDTVYGVAVDSHGYIYIADSRNNRVRKIANGAITTVAGTGVEGFSGDGSLAISAQLDTPHGVAVDGAGNLYIADTGNCRIRVVNPAGFISTVAGDGTPNFSGDGGPALSAELSYPAGLATDPAGNLYVADSWNYRVREITTNGNIRTIAGNGSYGPFGDGAPATAASLGLIQSLAVDAAGNVYLSDSYNHIVRTFAPGGNISTVVGGGFGPAVDGGAAQAANLKFPKGIAADSHGNLFISDSLNYRVREVSNGVISTVAGNGTQGYSGDGAPAIWAELNAPYGLAMAPGGDLVLSDLWNYRLRGVSPLDVPETVSTPGTPTGTALGAPSSSYSYSTGGASDNLGNPVQYQFSWGDGTYSGWLAVGTTTVSHSWPVGSYNVTAQAMSATNNSVVSSPSGALAVSIVVEAVSTPSTPSGSTAGTPGMSYSYSTGGASDNFGNPVQYQFNWGDGNYSGWLAAGTTTASHSWSAGTYSVTAQARSATNNLVLGSQSAALTVTISPLRFYPITPCRVADTRAGFGFTGTQGPPFLSGGTSRNFGVAGYCGVPANATAYSLNVTVVPRTNSLDYLTTWPTGQTMPNASTLNSWTGTAVANAALVPAGTNGQISIYASDATDVLFDINGYFAPPSPSGLQFYPLTPCRVADTRGGAGFTGTQGAPALAAGTSRNFQVAGLCGVPLTAAAYSLNVTVVPQTDSLDYLTTWPTGQTMPNASTLNSWTGTAVANAALVPAGTSGDISIYASDTTQVLFDINGYYAAPGAEGLDYYAMAPCRVADTRSFAGFTGQFGAPSMAGNTSRSFQVPLSVCSVPATAQAYSLNVTVVPSTDSLDYLTTWPTGQTMPNASTLNSWTGTVVANAALVPAGTGGAISIYVSDPANVLFDINGYFAPGQ